MYFLWPPSQPSDSNAENQSPKDKQQAKMMVDFMKWALTDGQKFAPELGYAPLPADIVKLEMAALGTIKAS